MLPTVLALFAIAACVTALAAALGAGWCPIIVPVCILAIYVLIDQLPTGKRSG